MRKDELEAALAENLSVRQIAERFGFASSGPVSYWLRKYKLTASGRSKRDISKYTFEVLAPVIARCVNMVDVLRELDLPLTTGNHRWISHRVKLLGIDRSHFVRGAGSVRRKSAGDILVVLPLDVWRTSADQLRRAMLELGVEERCLLCGLGTEWQGLPLVLQVDHIDGDWRNNLLSNLRFLCPNCHTQQITCTQGRRAG